MALNTVGITSILRPFNLVVLLAALAYSPGPASAQSPKDVEIAATLAARWTRIAYQRFEKAGAFTSQDSRNLLEHLIVMGATRAVRQGASPKQLADANAGITRFADAMVKFGVRQPDGKIRLGERSFREARSWICPLYPFC